MPIVTSTEQRYLEARRQLDEVSTRLSMLDEQVRASGTATDRRSILIEANDPAIAARRLLQREWPDRIDLHHVVTEWLTAYRATTRIWATLPPATQMRLAQPSEGERRDLRPGATPGRLPVR